MTYAVAERCLNSNETLDAKVIEDLPINFLEAVVGQLVK